MASVNQQPAGRQRGAYEGAVRLKGSAKDTNLGDLVIEIHELVGGSAGAGAVAETVALNTTYSSSNDTDGYLYSPSAKPLRLVRIPTLEELGFDPATHSLEAKVFGHFRADSVPVAIDMRLVDSDGNAVGSPAAKTVSKTDRDDVHALDFQAVDGGALYSLDFKKQAAGAAEVTLSNQMFLIRVKES